MISTWRSLTFMIVISSFVLFITCLETENSGTTSASVTTTSDVISTEKPATTTTGNNGAPKTPALRCIDLCILRPIRWLVEVPLKMIWTSVVRAKDSLATLYGISASTTNQTATKNV